MKNTNRNDLLKLFEAMRDQCNAMAKIFEDDEKMKMAYIHESMTFDQVIWAMTDKETFKAYCNLFVKE